MSQPNTFRQQHWRNFNEECMLTEYVPLLKGNANMHLFVFLLHLHFSLLDVINSRIKNCIKSTNFIKIIKIKTDFSSQAQLLTWATERNSKPHPEP